MNELDKKDGGGLQHIITRRRPTLYCLESVENSIQFRTPPGEGRSPRAAVRSPWCGRRLQPCHDRESSVQSVGIKSCLRVGKCHSPFWNIPDKPSICRFFTSGSVAQALYRRHSPNYGALPAALRWPRCTLNGVTFSRCLGLLPPTRPWTSSKPSGSPFLR